MSTAGSAAVPNSTSYGNGRSLCTTDQSGNEFLFGLLDTNSGIVDATDEDSDGVISDGGSGASTFGTLLGPGPCWVLAGGAVDAGDIIKCDSTRRALATVTATDLPCGIALTSAAAAGEKIQIFYLGEKLAKVVV